MDHTLVIILLPSLIAMGLGLFVGDQYGFTRAVRHVEAMPLGTGTYNLSEDEEGTEGACERARR